MPKPPAPCGQTPQSDFASQYRRVFEAAECATQVELAAFLGMRQSSISDAKRRGSVPSYWLVKLLEKNRTNPAWVLTGQGPRLLLPADAPETRPLGACATRELVTELVRRALEDMG